MTSAYLILDGASAAHSIRKDFESVGVEVLGASQPRSMVEDVVRSAPDLVVCYDSHPGDTLFAGTASLRSVSPRPVVVFTTDSDAEKIERAAASGIHCYVVDGYGPHRLRSLMHIARARFQIDQILREELLDTKNRFSERKLVDRAKGILMRVRNIDEDEAYKVLRTAAMQAKLRVGQIAQQVIDAARFAEAVNRAGQLRMLCQRHVKLYALMCAGMTPGDTAALCRLSIEQVESNLAVLTRTLSKPTFGDLVEGVVVAWSSLKRALIDTPTTERIARIDELAERLLKQAEALTRTLEVAGFAAALRVINVSGRQRMLSQRLAKQSLVATLVGGDTARAQLLALAETSREFANGLAFLESVPLSTPEIRDLLVDAATAWAAFEPVLKKGRNAENLAAIARDSELLLSIFDRLTDQYERSVQMLMS